MSLPIITVGGSRFTRVLREAQPRGVEKLLFVGADLCAEEWFQAIPDAQKIIVRNDLTTIAFICPDGDMRDRLVTALQRTLKLTADEIDYRR